MISLSELLHGHDINDVPAEHQQNLEELLKRINLIREAWGQPMIVTSGYRSAEDQARINPKAPQSKHMIGCAVDIADPDESLAAWNHANIALLEQVGLWCEATESTVGWEHYQWLPPGSGNRFFIP
jgi:uncharacterized protein YcbK (DUF882 family)